MMGGWVDTSLSILDLAAGILAAIHDALWWSFCAIRNWES